MAQPRRLTTPPEHGALVTLGGAVLLAALTAPQPAVAVAAAAAVTAAYMARGPIERKRKRLRLRAWDPAALIAYALAAAAGVAVVARERADAAALIAAIAIAIPVGGALTRSATLRRSVIVEAAGMLAVGASAGADVYAGGAAPVRSLALAIALAGYAASAIFLVRAHTRPLEPRQRRLGAWVAIAFLCAGASAAGAIEPRLALAFVPRAAHALARTLWLTHAKRIGMVALRESLELVLFVVLIAAVG